CPTMILPRRPWAASPPGPTPKSPRVRRCGLEAIPAAASPDTLARNFRLRRTTAAQELPSCGDSAMSRIAFTDDDLSAIAFERYHHPEPFVQRKLEVLWLKSQGLAHHDIARLAGVSRASVHRSLPPLTPSPPPALPPPPPGPPPAATPGKASAAPWTATGPRWRSTSASPPRARSRKPSTPSSSGLASAVARPRSAGSCAAWGCSRA